MTFKSKLMEAVVIGGSSLLMATGAAAQSADRAEADTLETVRVLDAIIVKAEAYVPEENITANKTNIPLIQTPQSVSVITRDQIDLLAFQDLQQATRYTAGIASENYGPDLRFDFLTSRGFIPSNTSTDWSPPPQQPSQLRESISTLLNLLRSSKARRPASMATHRRAASITKRHAVCRMSCGVSCGPGLELIIFTR